MIIIIIIINYLKETPLDAYVKRADPDQTALDRSLLLQCDTSGPTLVDLTSIFCSMYLHESLFVYLFIMCGA